MPPTLDLYARDVTGEAKQRRRAFSLKLALAVFLLTATLIWFTV